MIPFKMDGGSGGFGAKPQQAQRSPFGQSFNAPSLQGNAVARALMGMGQGNPMAQQRMQNLAQPLGGRFQSAMRMGMQNYTGQTPAPQPAPMQQPQQPTPQPQQWQQAPNAAPMPPQAAPQQQWSPQPQQSAYQRPPMVSPQMTPDRALAALGRRQAPGLAEGVFLPGQR